MKNCRTTSNDSIFVFGEKRSILRLANPDRVSSTKITVDGCEITEGIRCDYLHLAKGLEIFIELKGQDLNHAIAQIERTIILLSSDARKQRKTSYIICTRSPMASTEIQNFDKQFRKKYNSRLIIKSSPHNDQY
jgi:hypothetical protein